ncbi:MAG: flagellar biosynthetic protein FliO, partial [Planctomycetota bacterium]
AEDPGARRIAASSADDEPPPLWRSLAAPRVLGGLAAVIGLIVLLRLALRRAAGPLGGGGRPSGVLEVLARYPVGRGQQLILLKVARRLLLVHQSGPAMRTLSELSDPEEVAVVLARIEAGSRRGSRSFRSALQRYETDHRAHETTPRGATLLPAGEPEIVDLTQAPHAALRSLLETRRAT